jgi:Tol biopolymer transport system component
MQALVRTTSIVFGLAAAAGCASSEQRMATLKQSTGSLSLALTAARQEAEGEPRRIWSGKDADASGAPSPDGALLSYTDWSTLSVGVRDLRTGENRVVVRGSAAAGGFPETSAFSNDQKRLAYRWIEGKGVDLRAVDIAGGAPRVIVPKSADIASIVPMEWTADDREILVTVGRADRTFQVAFADVATGALRVVRSFQWGDAGRGSAALSRDGRYLALSVPTGGPSSGESDVVILTRDASREVSRFGNPGIETIVGWAADGRLFYQNSRKGAADSAAAPLFALPTRDGKPAGSPQLVKSDMSRVLASHITSDGRLFYGLLSGSYDVYIAEVDVANARLLSPAARVSHRLVGFNQGIDWTADGRYTAYLVREGAAPRSPGIVAIRDQESGNVLELRPGLDYINPAIRWSPDGRTIAAQGTDAKGRLGLNIIDAHSGKANAIVFSNPKGGVIHRPQWSADGRSIYYAVSDVDHPNFRIMRHEMESGAEHEVYAPTARLSPTFAISQDDANLVVMEAGTDSATISVVPTTGQEARPLVRVATREPVSSIAWSRDGKYVLFSQLNVQKMTGELYRVSANGGPVQPVGLEMKNLAGLRVHPDGRRIGFTGGEAEMEVWTLETKAPTRVGSRH